MFGNNHEIQVAFCVFRNVIVLWCQNYLLVCQSVYVLNDDQFFHRVASKPRLFRNSIITVCRYFEFSKALVFSIPARQSIEVPVLSYVNLIYRLNCLESILMLKILLENLSKTVVIV